MIVRILFLLAFVFSFYKGVSQSISPQTRVSIITCDEGDEIYSLFGHSALRFYDPYTHIDFVYNWGMFEFGENELEFQIKFAKGRLRYYMAEELYENFMSVYQWEKRTVREQILNLNYDEIKALWNAVQENYKPENRYYRYDFFFDNCSTRIAELLRKVLGDKLIEPLLPESEKYSYRQLIDRQVKQSQPWSDFGIDLALGAKIDKITNSHEMMFLPRYLEQSLALDSIKTENGNIPLVKRNNVLLNGIDRENIAYQGITPLQVAWGIFLFALLIHIFNIPYLTTAFDATLLLFYGVLGVVILLLWIATDHQATKLNYNLIWANPLHLVAFVSLFSKKLQQRFTTFYLVMSIYHLAIILFWIAIPQEFNEAFRPLILLLVLIYYYRFRKT